MLTAANAALWNGVLVPCRLLLLSYAVETADMGAVLSVMENGDVDFVIYE